MQNTITLARADSILEHIGAILNSLRLSLTFSTSPHAEAVAEGFRRHIKNAEGVIERAQDLTRVAAEINALIAEAEAVEPLRSLAVRMECMEFLEPIMDFVASADQVTPRELGLEVAASRDRLRPGRSFTRQAVTPELAAQARGDQVRCLRNLAALGVEFEAARSEIRIVLPEEHYNVLVRWEVLPPSPVNIARAAT